MNRILQLIGAVTLASLSASPAPAHEPITIAQADWTGPVVVCGIIGASCPGRWAMRYAIRPFP